MDPGKSDHQRRLLSACVASLSDCPGGRFSGRGIVICAGGPSMFTNAFVLLRVLRQVYRSSLPVEVWHLGPELSSYMASLLEAEGARIVDARAVLAEYPANIEDGWQLKIYSLIHSSFREVLLLDADQVPAQDPILVFEWAEFRATGAVFWPDIMTLSKANPIWAMCGLPARDCRSLESGQVLVDKARHWQALQVVLHLNEQAHHYYDVIYGDKDTFLVAWLLTGHDHAVVPHLPIADTRCLFQRDFAGAVLFQHRTGCKWRYGSDQYEVAGFVHEGVCLAALTELRTLWNGRVFNAPPRSLAARQLETRIAAVGMFDLDAEGEPLLSLVLRPGNDVQGQIFHTAANWYVADGEEGPVLCLVDRDRINYVLEPVRGVEMWHGHSEYLPRTAVRMRPSRGGPMPSPPAGFGLLEDLLRAAQTPSGVPAEEAARLEAALSLVLRAEPQLRVSIEACLKRTELEEPVRRALDRVLAESEVSAPSVRHGPSLRPVHQLYDTGLYLRR
jgi:hypothetical protein